MDVTAAVLIGVFLFHVPFRGSPLLLAVMATMFLLGSLGLGIFISAALKSQLLATQLAMLATFIPSLLLSGLIFDIASMPWPLRVVSLAVPARYFVVVLRSVFLKGVGAEVLWQQGVAMIVYAVVGLRPRRPRLPQGDRLVRAPRVNWSRVRQMLRKELRQMFARPARQAGAVRRADRAAHRLRLRREHRRAQRGDDGGGSRPDVGVARPRLGADASGYFRVAGRASSPATW